MTDSTTATQKLQHLADVDKQWPLIWELANFTIKQVISGEKTLFIYRSGYEA